MKPAPTLHPDLAAAIYEVLARAAAPVNLAKLRSQLTGPYKVPAKLKEAFAGLLDAEAQAGRIHVWPAATAKAGPRYWARDSKAWAEPAMLEAARTAAPAKKLVGAVAKQFGKPAAEVLLAELVEGGKLIRVPLFGGAKAKLCSRIEDEAAFRAELDAARQVIEAGYRRLGSHNTSPAPVPPPEIESDIESDILDALAALEPRKGLLVTAPRLYRALPEIPKPALDQALLKLQDARRVILHQHSNPHGLSPEERDSLIPDGAGNFYVGACWRLEE